MRFYVSWFTFFFKKMGGGGVSYFTPSGATEAVAVDEVFVAMDRAGCFGGCEDGGRHGGRGGYRGGGGLLGGGRG